jgi:hypothetical protein
MKQTYKIELKPTKQVAKVNPKFYLSIYTWIDRGPLYQKWHPVIHAIGHQEWGAIQRARKDVQNILGSKVNAEYFEGLSEALEDFILRWAQS